jgi:hypothetical protein
MQSIPKHFHKFFDENTVTIITDEDGKETVETFTGKEADKKIKEIDKSDKKDEAQKKSIKKTIIIKQKDSKDSTTNTN